MKRTGIKLFIGVAAVITVLGVLRYRPFGDFTGSRAEVIHKGGNKHADRELTVGFLPVTCHLTCPVTDFASKTTETNTNFNSRVFTDFPTVVSALEAKQVQATFMIVPLAMKLREQGVPVKICYLGHRDGSQVVVGKNSKIRSLVDLKGKKVAVPSLFSNQNFVLHKLMSDYQMQPNDINFVVLPPPDMPTSLAAGAIDAYFVGEPFCAKAELDGVGRVLYYARDIWPNFISCALVVHEDLIKSQPDMVRDLVRGIAQSGAWAETHRAEAAKLVAPYYRQDEKVLNYVLTADPKRVSYVNLTPTDKDLARIEDMGLSMGLLTKRTPMNELIDRKYVPEVIREASIDVAQIPTPNK
ncbi:ABC transporter substrate-binding protein [Spirosoma aureum]|uniref:ABC transporter substrate-binding protein n=1 Tax=Spirosoma aureum TaxID=2692134 RepID=A0A6G9AJ93_9BACT|nr:ABC transporter substrate-binding protein [Spirosoma aureum]QIP12518.1 ABC transporter substrate-binding protein [Spirosoma aureum]